MAQDDHTSRCSNSSGGGNAGGNGNGNSGAGGGGHRSAKKLKHKKVPQRGMGVAQLEKIISEEEHHQQHHQQKKNDVVLTHNSIISPSNSSSNLANIQTIPSFRAASIPPPPPLPHLVSKTEGGNASTKSVSKPLNLISGCGGNWSRLWNGGDYKYEGEKQKQKQKQKPSQNQNYDLDHSRYTAASFAGNLVALPYESNPSIWPPAPNLMLQRSQHFQQPCSSSSMVNVSVNSSSACSSSVMNFQIEPPSNQSYCGNNFQPLWPEEEKMVGMKRSYPFSLENAPIPSFQCKFPSAYVSRSDEYASCSNGGGNTSIEPAHSYLRENCSSSGAISDAITKKFIDENQILTRDFLKLAPPQTSQSNSNSKDILRLSPCIGEQPQFERLQLQKDQSKDLTHLSGRSGSNAQAFLSFFPPAKTSIGHQGSSNGEAGESVDLNLKL
ncbi:hypothetical protein QVD17_25835 [Tagetes erecta]|uniref:Uncharacterized protein n=1 Tax=Tagetes erecta TaxID=13708 RepID=A0AAD8NPH9_TARER|nr:hypothetical protein QVD17_25835 [Tagetes erecta]